MFTTCDSSFLFWFLFGLGFWGLFSFLLTKSYFESSSPVSAFLQEHNTSAPEDKELFTTGWGVTFFLGVQSMMKIQITAKRNIVCSLQGNRELIVSSWGLKIYYYPALLDLFLVRFSISLPYWSQALSQTGAWSQLKIQRLSPKWLIHFKFSFQ